MMMTLPMAMRRIITGMEEEDYDDNDDDEKDHDDVDDDDDDDDDNIMFGDHWLTISKSREQN